MPNPKLLFLDHNVWHLLFARRIDLAAELPIERFCLRVTKEAEFEIRALAKRCDTADLHAYIGLQRANAGVATDSFFGFADPNLSDENQRVAGFNIGRFASATELEFMSKLSDVIGSLRGSGLYKNEADLSLAARAMVATVVTFDVRGPLRTAYREGGDVVFLHDLRASGESLANFITARSRRA